MSPSFSAILSVFLIVTLASYFANYIKDHKWLAYVGLFVIMIVALQLIIGGLVNLEVLSINEKFNSLFNVGKAKRSKIDFYPLYDLLQNIPVDKYNHIKLKDLNEDISLLFSILKNTEQNLINDDYKKNFLIVKEKLVSKYQTLVN